MSCGNGEDDQTFYDVIYIVENTINQVTAIVYRSPLGSRCINCIVVCSITVMINDAFLR